MLSSFVESLLGCCWGTGVGGSGLHIIISWDVYLRKHRLLSCMKGESFDHGIGRKQSTLPNVSFYSHMQTLSLAALPSWTPPPPVPYDACMPFKHLQVSVMVDEGVLTDHLSGMCPAVPYPSAHTLSSLTHTVCPPPLTHTNIHMLRCQ